MGCDRDIASSMVRELLAPSRGDADIEDEGGATTLADEKEDTDLLEQYYELQLKACISGIEAAAGRVVLCTECCFRVEIFRKEHTGRAIRIQKSQARRIYSDSLPASSPANPQQQRGSEGESRGRERKKKATVSQPWWKKGGRNSQEAKILSRVFRASLQDIYTTSLSLPTYSSSASSSLHQSHRVGDTSHSTESKDDVGLGEAGSCSECPPPSTSSSPSSSELPVDILKEEARLQSLLSTMCCDEITVNKVTSAAPPIPLLSNLYICPRTACSLTFCIDCDRTLSRHEYDSHRCRVPSGA